MRTTLIFFLVCIGLSSCQEKVIIPPLDAPLQLRKSNHPEDIYFIYQFNSNGSVGMWNNEDHYSEPMLPFLSVEWYLEDDGFVVDVYGDTDTDTISFTLYGIDDQEFLLQENSNSYTSTYFLTPAKTRIIR